MPIAAIAALIHSHRPSRSHGRGLTRSLVASTFLLAAAVVPTVDGAKAQEQPPQEQEFVEEGRLSRVPDDAVAIFGDVIVPESWHTDEQMAVDRDTKRTTTGTLIPIFSRREIWQLFLVNNYARTAVAIRDMDTLRITRTLILEQRPVRLSNGGSEWLTALDGDRRLFFLTSTFRGFLSIDLRTLAIRTHELPPHFLVPPTGGFTYDARGDRLVALASPAGSLGPANSTTFLQFVDLVSGAVEVRVVRACSGPLPATEGSSYPTNPFISDDGYVYLPCQRAGNSGAIVRIKYEDLLDPSSTEEVAVGATNLLAAFPDSASGRIAMPTQRGEIWVFDTATMSYIGVVGALKDRSKEDGVAYGLDPETGRIFFLSPTDGLGVVEGRYFPVPQARTQRSLAGRGQERLISDARNNRLFVLYGTGLQKARDHVIYRYRPASKPPARSDPDRNTSDQPEIAGVTESRYNANASGYGARVLLANGVSTVAPAPGAGALMPTADFLRNTFNAKCGFTDRELVAARVVRAEADTGSTVAESVPVLIDPRTRLDLDRPSRCEPYGKDASGDRLESFFATAPEPYDSTDERNPRWNRDPALCSTSEGDTPVVSHADDHGAPPLGTARAECPTPGKGDLQASARTALVGAVSVGRAEAKTSITRGAGRVRSRSEAVAADVSIGDGIRIGEIRSVAMSESDGRPHKDPMSTHTVTIRDVTVEGTAVCGVCDPRQVADALNRVLSGRAEFRFGQAGVDARLVKGSARGALTAVQKSEERQVSDRALVGDFTVEAPGVELIAYNDNGTWGRGRQLYQFAGVATSATYNIVPLPRAGDLGDLGDDSQVPDASDDRDAAVAAGDDGGESIDRLAGAEDVGLDSQPASATEDSGGGLLDRVGRALVAVGRGLRLFLTDPRHGVAILLGWVLLGLPAALFRRRLGVVEDA
ncbi:MAG: hypothetical protein M3394_00405 [Actinomycetota bacterium]|nr:hypothetical protein [Actinomycetota bacterium]